MRLIHRDPSTKAKIEVFPGTDGDWYWRLRAPNGQIIAVGGEGFKSRGQAKQQVRRARKAMAAAPVVDVETPQPVQRRRGSARKSGPVQG